MAERISDIAGGDNDYATLVLWEADKQGDITQPDPHSEVAEVYANITESGAIDLCELSGWLTDPANYIAIRAAVARSSSNPLRVGQAVTLKQDRTEGWRYVIEALAGAEFLRIDGLDLCSDVDTVAYPIIQTLYAASTTVADVQISNCVITHLGTSFTHGIVGHETDDSTAHVYRIWNCVVYHCHLGISCSVNTDTDAKWYLYNVTVRDCSDHGVEGQYAATKVAVNCIVYDCTNADFSGTFDSPSDYNFSEDDTAPEAAGNSIWGDTDGKTPDFVNVGAGVEDFHLQSTSDAIGVGTDDPGSGLYSDDVDGTERTSVWDMGGAEYIPVGGLPMPVAMRHYRGLRT